MPKFKCMIHVFGSEYDGAPRHSDTLLGSVELMVHADNHDLATRIAHIAARRYDGYGHGVYATDGSVELIEE
jgi:hypothetical protein